MVVAAHEELVRPQVMTAVEDLVARGASGVLEVTGTRPGAFFLDGGRIAFARARGSPASPPGCAPSARQWPAWGAAAGRDADDAAVAGVAVQRGYLTPGRAARAHPVHRRRRLPGADGPVRGGLAHRRHPLHVHPYVLDGDVPAAQPRLVRGEAGRRAARMAEHGLAPTTAVALRDLRTPAAVLTREQWAVACQIGDHASARELAARRGAALIDTIDCLGSLTQVGLCGPVRSAGARGCPRCQAGRRRAGARRRDRTRRRRPARPPPAQDRPERNGPPAAAADDGHPAPSAQRAQEAQLGRQPRPETWSTPRAGELLLVGAAALPPRRSPPLSVVAGAAAESARGLLRGRPCAPRCGRSSCAPGNSAWRRSGRSPRGPRRWRCQPAA